MSGEAFVNRRFNRIEAGGVHTYLTGREEGPGGDVVPHPGLVKCKLVHARWGSVILPDQLYLGGEPTHWVQPLAFPACLLGDIGGGNYTATLWADISCGATVRIEFQGDQLRGKFADGSELYDCTIRGPADLREYATGEARLNADGVPELLLFHHTAETTKPRILESGVFLGSPWNVQGTRRLANVHYAYFTSLDRITTPEDLVQIGMASDGKVRVPRDGGGGLELPVYRGSTLARTATVSVFVDSTALASQHLLFHRGYVPRYYEVCLPFVHRVGLNPGDALPFDAAGGVVGHSVKRFSHLIAGDATTLAGLEAPYDEEHTKDIFKVEHTPPGHSALSFWFAFCNRDHFSGKPFEPYLFGGAGV